MTVTLVDKDKGIVTVVENGVTHIRTITYSDAVLSLPPAGYKKVTNIYIEPTSGKLAVVCEE